MIVPTVLVCDDEPSVGAALRRTLAAHGVRVLVDTSSDALSLAQCHRPQVILLDLLQHRDGLVILKELKADPQTAHIPVVVMSGLFLDGEPPDVACPGAVGLGAIAAIPKPLPDAFVELLAAWARGDQPCLSAGTAAGLPCASSATITKRPRVPS